MSTQNEVLVSYLQKNKRGITTLEAMFDFAICRLSERIREIERCGVRIKRISESGINGNRNKVRYTRYFYAGGKL